MSKVRRSSRLVHAHLPHPDLPGETLCGSPSSRVEPCPSCVARRDALLLIHVQSPRDPTAALCGLPLRVVGGRRGPAPAYLASSGARRAVRALRAPVCQWCLENLRRLDEAADRRRSASDPPAPVGGGNTPVTTGVVGDIVETTMPSQEVTQ